MAPTNHISHFVYCLIVAIILCKGGSAQSFDYWNVSGGQFIDSSGKEVYYSGVNWNGFEASNCVVDGLWGGLQRSYSSHLQQMAFAGFNLIRLPFAGTCVQNGTYPAQTAIDSSYNSDLRGLTTLAVMQKVIQAAATFGIRVILDFHRRDKVPLTGTPEDGLWFNATFPETFFLDTWQTVTGYLQNEPNIVGADIFNEPRGGSVWKNESSNPIDFYSAVYSASEVIHAIQPNWIIFAQGLYKGVTWWGEDLTALYNASYRMNLTVPNKLAYSIHDYGPEIYSQPWFSDSTFPSNLPAFWDSFWGFVQKQGIAPVWVGEFGSKLDITSPKYLAESQWLTALINYVQNNSLSWTWFTWGPNSGDTGGMLLDDWHTLNSVKLALVHPILYPSYQLPSNVSSPPPPAAPPPPVHTSGSLRFGASTLVVKLVLGTIPFLPVVWLLL